MPQPSDGIIGWMFAKQAAFYRDMSRIIRLAKTDGSAVWTLLGVSFLYGIFHAAGPGHGKAVISSYLVANEETWRRGIVLSFASALLQAFVAVAIVGIAAVLLNATAGQMCSAERVIELASYALIALVGARLIWVKGKGFLREARGLGRPLHAVGAAVTPKITTGTITSITIMATIIIIMITIMATTTITRHDHHHDHSHDHHDHDDHDHDSAWGHAHGPEPEELAGPGGWRRGFSAILAVGLRPCSGAIIVLVFALAQGLFWAGVAATFVMGLGTAITVAVIATLAVGFRSAAKHLAGYALGLRHAGAARRRGRRRGGRALLRHAVADGLHGGRTRRLLLSWLAYGRDHHHALRHRRRRAGRHDARLSAGPRRRRCHRAGEAQGLPARFPRRHRSSLDARTDA